MTSGKRFWKLLKVFSLSLVNLSIPVGVCPKCGIKKIGYALNNPRHQMCPKCGTGLKITEGEKQSPSDGYSPFIANEYFLDANKELEQEKRIEDKNA